MTHIKIGDISPKIQYVADGDILTFTFPFAVFKTSDVEVYFDGQVQSSGFSVTLNADCDGGFVVFEEAPKDGVLLTIRRYLIIERTTDFQEGGAFRAKVLNDELDYQTACLQQLSEDLKSSMVLPAYANSSINMTLPLPEAGRAIVWNDEAAGLANSDSVFDNIVPIAEASKIAAEQALAEAIIARDEVLNFKIAAETAQSLAEQAKLAAEVARDAADDIVNLGALANKDTIGTIDIDAGSVSLEKLETVAENSGKFMGYNEEGVPSPIEVDTSSLLNASLSNINSDGQTAISNYMTPDYSARVSVSDATLTSSTGFVAPSNGVIYVYTSNYDSNTTVYVDGVSMGIGGASNYGDYHITTILLAKDTVVKCSTGGTSSGNFDPMKTVV